MPLSPRTSTVASVGAARSITQLFAYEIPLFLSILAPALLANTWSFQELAEFYANKHPLLGLLNLVGLFVALVSLLGKLERVPFDIPEAETEIVAGTFTEYSGRLLALFRLTTDIELIVGATLLAAVFLPFGLGLRAEAAFGLYVLKVLAIVAGVALGRSLFARLRIDQMLNFCWKVATPVAFLQLLANLVAKGIVVS